MGYAEELIRVILQKSRKNLRNFVWRGEDDFWKKEDLREEA